MKSVWLVWHIHQVSKTNKDEKLIGVYKTEADAKAAIERLHGKPGFRDRPDGFWIDAYELNMDHWTEGYVTI